MKLKTVQDYKQGLLEGKRTALAQAITLIESKAPKHKAIAQQLIKEIYPHTGHSVRIGFTGVPGAGKSTLIDKFDRTYAKMAIPLQFWQSIQAVPCLEEVF